MSLKSSAKYRGRKRQKSDNLKKTSPFTKIWNHTFLIPSFWIHLRVWNDHDIKDPNTCISYHWLFLRIILSSVRAKLKTDSFRRVNVFKLVPVQVSTELQKWKKLCRLFCPFAYSSGRIAFFLTRVVLIFLDTRKSWNSPIVLDFHIPQSMWHRPTN